MLTDEQIEKLAQDAHDDSTERLAVGLIARVIREALELNDKQNSMPNVDEAVRLWYKFAIKRRPKGTMDDHITNLAEALRVAGVQAHLALKSYSGDEWDEHRIDIAKRLLGGIKADLREVVSCPDCENLKAEVEYQKHRRVCAIEKVNNVVSVELQALKEDS